MSRNSASSMFGGAGGQGARASVSSLQNLRNALRPESQPQAPSSGLSGPTPADDKKTMENLNNRLSGYLNRGRKLEKSSHDLEEQIREILEKRGQTADRDWDEIEKPLADLRKEILSLEEILKDADGRYRREMVRLNRIIQQLGAELTKVREQVERQTEEYQALLNIKMKLEAEIDSYRHLLGGIDDGADFSLEQALQNNVLSRQQN